MTIPPEPDGSIPELIDIEGGPQDEPDPELDPDPSCFDPRDEDSDTD